MVLDIQQLVFSPSSSLASSWWRYWQCRGGQRFRDAFFHRGGINIIVSIGLVILQFFISCAGFSDSRKCQDAADSRLGRHWAMSSPLPLPEGIIIQRTSAAVIFYAWVVPTTRVMHATPRLDIVIPVELWMDS